MALPSGVVATWLRSQPWACSTVYSENVLPAGITAGPDGAMLVRGSVERCNRPIRGANDFAEPPRCPISLRRMSGRRESSRSIPATHLANFELDFEDDTGAPVSLPFSGGASSKLTGMLPAQGSAYFRNRQSVRPADQRMGDRLPPTLVISIVVP